MDVGAIGKGKGGKRETARRETATRSMARAARTTSTTALARARVRAPRNLMATVTSARSTGTWHETVARKKS